MTVSITAALLLSFFSFIPFKVADNMKITKNINTEYICMPNDKKPSLPPLPTAPGPRNVKGEVPVPKTN